MSETLEEMAVDNVGDDAGDSAGDTIEDRVIDLLNNAMYATKDTERVEHLKKVQELVIHHDILDNFLDEVLGFQSDSMVEVKKFVIGFIEAACKKDPEYFPKVIMNLNVLLTEENANVVKKAIQASTQLYKTFLKWVCKVKITGIVESTWDVWVSIKTHIIALLDSTDNDGVRTQCVKFMEMIVILQTKKDQWSTGDEFNIDYVTNNSLIDCDLLEEEAKNTFEQLIIYHGTPHISSVNLMATMQTLVIIARQRCQLFMSKVIEALEALHANLPPTLAKSQVSSVRKHLKLQLLLLLKHPAASVLQFQSQITQLLNDLGAGQSEINKCLQEVKKRGIKQEANIEVKRIKLEPEDDDDEGEITIPTPKITRTEANTTIDITAEDMIPHLNVISNVCDLVLVSMLSLPDKMPDHFEASYTPVAAAGTSAQIKYLARLLASQMTVVGLGKGVNEMVAKMTASQLAGKKAIKSEEHSQEKHQKLATLIGRTIDQELKKQEQHKQQQMNQQKVKLIQSGKSLSAGALKSRQLNLSEITKQLNEDVKDKMVLGAVNRILKYDSNMFMSIAQTETRVKILALLSSQYQSCTPNIPGLVEDYVFEDIRNRHDIAFTTIYNQYLMAKASDGDLTNYSRSLLSIFNNLIDKAEVKDRDHFLMKFFLEAPLITDGAIELLKNLILSDALVGCVSVGINILKSLIEKKKPQRQKFLNVLLELCVVLDKSEVRNNAIKTVRSIHEIWGGDVRETIEQFATKVLRYLLESKPPVELMKEGSDSWNEDNIKVCLILYLNLLPNNHKLVHHLSEVYVSTIADIKRVILRNLEGPVKGMGMNSPELLLLVENCSKGGETLVTRIIHVLTDKQPPSIELVSRVRDLYHKRVADVRFLIPVLNGLSKKEVISALPKLIQLNPIVVKEVFNRLLGAHVESGTHHQSPLSPAELLVALHNIDTTKCDMKTIIKATGLCFAEKNIYTAEVLAVVMQLLMEQNPLPTLLMRTVIQSLAQYPRLIGFVMNIMHRLIVKQVWKQKKVWEGFIKCCQRTKPQSFPVLYQLPGPQLQSVFAASPDLKTSLRQHVESLTDHQRSHINQTSLEVIFADDLMQTEGENNNGDSNIANTELLQHNQPENVPTLNITLAE